MLLALLRLPLPPLPPASWLLPAASLRLHVQGALQGLLGMLRNDQHTRMCGPYGHSLEPPAAEEQGEAPQAGGRLARRRAAAAVSPGGVRQAIQSVLKAYALWTVSPPHSQCGRGSWKGRAKKCASRAASHLACNSLAESDTPMLVSFADSVVLMLACQRWRLIDGRTRWCAALVAPELAQVPASLGS